MAREHDTPQDIVLAGNTADTVAQRPSKRRLASVDCLRGLTIAGMILANNPGNRQYIYGELKHAVWHGWTAVDFIFPFFLLLVGVCVALSIDREAVLTNRCTGFWGKVFRRTAILFALGLLENAYLRLSLEQLRIPGVLQRIAIVYLASAWLHVRLGNRRMAATIGAVLAGYWFFLAFVPVPGLGQPGLGPDVNWQGWIDQLVLRGHTWSRPTTWDPEGLLSTLPAIILGLIGVLAGRWLARGVVGTSKLAAIGLGMHLLGFAWHSAFPINKSLCTSSFVLFVSGAALMLLAGLHWLMDVRGKVTWASPFIVLGTNPLIVYVGASFVSSSLRHVRWTPLTGGSVSLQSALYAWLFGGLADTRIASLAWAVLFLFGIFLGARWLYARRIVIRA